MFSDNLHKLKDSAFPAQSTWHTVHFYQPEEEYSTSTLVLKHNSQASLIFTDGFKVESCIFLSTLLLDEGLNLPQTESLMPAASSLRRLASRSSFCT